MKLQEKLRKTFNWKVITSIVQQWQMTEQILVKKNEVAKSKIENKYFKVIFLKNYLYSCFTMRRFFFCQVTNSEKKMDSVYRRFK